MEVFTSAHAKLLYYRFGAIYGDKFIKPYHDDDFRKVWYEEWASGLEGIDVHLIKDVLEFCKVNLEWSPSIAEFRRICEKSSGVPSASEALSLAIRKDFSHPVVALSYDKVGSWAMKNDKESTLTGKFQHAYTEVLNEYRKNPNETLAKLEEFKQRLALPEPPPKIPSKEEIIGWGERFKREEMAKVDKAKLEAKNHPSWPKDSVTRGHRYFDQKLYDSRRNYLVKMDENESSTLSSNDQYDRIRFIRENIGLKLVSEYRAGNPIGEDKKSSPLPSNVVKMVYKNWIKD